MYAVFYPYKNIFVEFQRNFGLEKRHFIYSKEYHFVYWLANNEEINMDKIKSLTVQYIKYVYLICHSIHKEKF